MKIEIRELERCLLDGIFYFLEKHGIQGIERLYREYREYYQDNEDDYIFSQEWEEISAWISSYLNVVNFFREIPHNMWYNIIDTYFSLFYIYKKNSWDTKELQSVNVFREILERLTGWNIRKI